MSSALTEFIQLLVGGLGDMAQGIGSGMNDAVTKLFLATDATTGAVTGLSNFGGLTAVFAGVALACTLTALVFHWVSSIGK